MIIKNANGCEYDVLSRVENMETGVNLYLLAQIPEEVRDGETVDYWGGGLPVQYVVARDWDERSKNWSRGDYFWKHDYKEAKAYYMEEAETVLYRGGY